MAGRFRRTITFPAPSPPSADNPNGPLPSVATKRSSYQNRSSSLPVRFHPIVSDLDDGVASLRSWSESARTTSSARLLEGVDHISVVLVSLSDLLSHPQAVEPIKNSPITDRFLDDLMRLADSYDTFRISLINLSHVQGETQAAVRRWDATRLASAVCAQRHAGKDIVHLATKAKAAVKTKPAQLLEKSSNSNPSGSAEAGAVLPIIFCDASFALAAASSELISGLAKLSNDAVSSIAPVIAAGGAVKLLRIWWVVDLLRWKGRARKRAMERKGGEGLEGIMERKVAMEKLVGLESCIAALESGSDKIFRALVNARVTVLNILTPSI